MTTIIPVDQRVREKTKMGSLKRYPNPNRPGAFLKLNDADAKRLGLLGRHTAEAPARGPGRPLDAVTNEGGAPLVSSSTTAAAPRPPGVPAGAMLPAGPTHRARAKAKAATEEAPVPDPDDETPTPPAAPDTAPKDKARTPPTRRRRRAVAPEGGDR